MVGPAVLPPSRPSGRLVFIREESRLAGKTAGPTKRTVMRRTANQLRRAQRDQRHVIGLRARTELQDRADGVIEQGFDAVFWRGVERLNETAFTELFAALDASFEHSV